MLTDVFLSLAFAAVIVLAWILRPRWGVAVLVGAVLLAGLALGGKALSNLSDGAWLEASSALHEAGGDEFANSASAKLLPGFLPLRALATFTSEDGRQVRVYLEYTNKGWRVVPRVGTYFPPPAAIPR